MANTDFTALQKEMMYITALETGLREDCEKAIMGKLEEIFEIYKAYNPAGRYLHLSILIDEEGETFFSVNNDYVDEDQEKPLTAQEVHNE